MARGKTEWGQPVGSRNVRPGEWSHRRWRDLRGGDNLLREEGRGGAETAREWGKPGRGRQAHTVGVCEGLRSSERPKDQQCALSRGRQQVQRQAAGRTMLLLKAVGKDLLEATTSY